MIDTKELFVTDNLNDLNNDDDIFNDIIAPDILNSESNHPSSSTSLPLLPTLERISVEPSPLDDLLTKLTELTRQTEDVARIRREIEKNLPRRENSIPVVNIGSDFDPINKEVEELDSTSSTVVLHKSPNMYNIKSSTNILKSDTKEDALSYLDPKDINDIEDNQQVKPQFLLTEILNNLDKKVEDELDPFKEEIKAMYVQDFLFAPFLGFSSPWTKAKIEPVLLSSERKCFRKNKF